MVPQALPPWPWQASWPPCASPRARCAITPSSSREPGRYESSPAGEGVLIRVRVRGRAGCSDARAIITSYPVIIPGSDSSMSRCNLIYGGSVLRYLTDDLLPLIALGWDQPLFGVMLVSHFNRCTMTVTLYDLVETIGHPAKKVHVVSLLLRLIYI